MGKETIQIGISATADFEENTWTFKMSEDYSVKVGEFALVPKDRFDRLTTGLADVRKLAIEGKLDKTELLMEYIDEMIDEMSVGINF